MGMSAGGTARAEPAAQATPGVPVLADLCVSGDLGRGKKEAWRPAGGRILEAETGFSSLSVWAHWIHLRCEPPPGNL